MLRAEGQLNASIPIAQNDLKDICHEACEKALAAASDNNQKEVATHILRRLSQEVPSYKFTVQVTIVTIPQDQPLKPGLCLVQDYVGLYADPERDGVDTQLWDNGNVQVAMSIAWFKA